MPAIAVQHVRRMRGGAQSHLMRTADGGYYVVKFKNNPQHLRVLANELLATKLGERIGLPVPGTDVVEVSDWLTRNSPELNIQLASKTIQCEPGLQFGSQYIMDPQMGHVVDYLPHEMLVSKVRNLASFAGILVLDKWTCNANGRQAVFYKKARDQKYTATFIDQGYCFNAGEWNFPDAPLRGVYAWNSVYMTITGWDSFEPWLSRVETMSESAVWECAELVPPEWYGEWDDMERLVTTLLKRRSRVRELIDGFRKCARNPFVNWRESVGVSAND